VPEAPAEELFAQISLSGVKVLVVDDEPIVTRLLTRVLEIAQHNHCGLSAGGIASGC
jgi:hypothetical protein